jgi:CRISPR-associated protein Cas2
MDLLVVYDIADTDGPGARRLRRVHEVCSRFGVWVQFSVFECRVSPERAERLLASLQDEIDPSVDSVLIYRFDGSIRDHRRSLGRHGGHEVDEPWIV